MTDIDYTHRRRYERLAQHYRLFHYDGCGNRLSDRDETGCSQADMKAQQHIATLTSRGTWQWRAN